MSHYSSMEEDHHHHQEMQLLSFTKPHHHHHHASSSHTYAHPPPSWAGRFGPGPSLDLQLSISLTPLKPAGEFSRRVEALKWEAAEQIRLAAMEKAYAEHVMEMTKREMEVAQSEFLSARSLWDRARDEVERADKMRERATNNNSSCMEITCFSCSQKFRP